MICLTKEKYAKKNKSKKNQNALYMIESVFLGMYLKGDSPHQAVMIVCELN